LAMSRQRIAQRGRAVNGSRRVLPDTERERDDD
jgi:hypothetical protein